MLADFAITADNPDEQYWYDAQVAAGVSFQNQFHNRYGFQRNLRHVIMI